MKTTQSPKYPSLALVTGLAVFAALWAMPGTARGQLFATVNGKTTFYENGNGSIRIYDPVGNYTAFVDSFNKPRGLVFDRSGNLFVTSNSADLNNDFTGTIVKCTPDGGQSVFNSTPFPINFFLEVLVMDSTGTNLFVAAQNLDDTASTIYKISSDGAVCPFGFDPNLGSAGGSVPGQCFGLAIDSDGNIYASGATDSTNAYGAIYKFTPDGERSVFADSTNFASGQGPTGLTFDASALSSSPGFSSGNLFVSVAAPPYDTTTSAILKFTPDGTASTFADGLRNPRGMVFDKDGNLFVADIPATTAGSVLEFPIGFTLGDPPVIFAADIGNSNGNSGPEYLTFQQGVTTPVGSDQTVEVGTIGTGIVDLNFSEVTLAGDTSVTLIDPASAGDLPSWYQLAGTNVAFDLITTAQYTPPILITFQVNPRVDSATFDTMAILHNDGSGLVDVTISKDAVNQIIYGSVSSLSPFVIAKFALSAQVQQPINADGTSVFSARRGVVPVKFTLTDDGISTCVLPPATIALTRTSGGTTGAIDESVYSGSADTGSNFRTASCQYVYNLTASALGVGTYRVDIEINGTVVGSAVFQLK